MVTYVIQAARCVNPDRIILVVGHQRERVMEVLRGEGVEFAIQEEQLGTAHALMQTSSTLVNFHGEVLVLSGDTPLLTGQTISQLLERHRTSHAAATVLTAILDAPFGYGRILRSAEDMLDAIVEEKDATPQQRAVKEVNTGTYCFQAPLIFSILEQIGKDNRQGEFYLTDAITILRSGGLPVATAMAEDSREVLGVNSMEQLLEVEGIVASRQTSKN
jgi:bifunctional UDP-N-acetylglucosamine pyrophosphorylase/glucosamine-1-phosphate N-acetyltransferase